MSGSVTSRTFGVLPGSQPVKAWTLVGEGGLLLEVIEWGGVVTRLLVPDRDGCLDDVVLGFTDFNSYLVSNAYFGAIVGRVAGRITGARFVLDDKVYPLTENDPPNHLHGGSAGFDRQLWSAEPGQSSDGAVSLGLTHVSRDGTEGYPGTVRTTVTYTVTSNNTVLFESNAVSDRLTPFSLTHHSYFNLGGLSSISVDDHELQILSDSTILTDDKMTLLGSVAAVSAANDFRQPRSLGRAIPDLFHRHGDLYRLAHAASAGALTPAACLAHAPSGRVLKVATTEQYLQLYTASGLHEESVGKHGRQYGPHAGVCLECEGYPDAANSPQQRDSLLQPDVPRRTLTAYEFSVAPGGHGEASACLPPLQIRANKPTSRSLRDARGRQIPGSGTMKG